MSVYNVLNKLSQHVYLYISTSITSYVFLLVFKIMESIQCILKVGRFLSQDKVFKGTVATCMDNVTEMKKYFRLKDMLNFNVL